MDIFWSGVGTLTNDTDLLFVRLVYEEQINFWEKETFTKLLVSNHHIKTKPNQVNTHFFKYFHLK